LFYSTATNSKNEVSQLASRVLKAPRVLERGAEMKFCPVYSDSYEKIDGEHYSAYLRISPAFACYPISTVAFSRLRV